MGTNKQGKGNGGNVVLHTLKDLGTQPQYQVDINSAVTALQGEFSAETAAIDLAIAHTEEALRLQAEAQGAARVLREMRTRKDFLVGVIGAAEKAVQKAFDENPTIRQQKVWMLAHAKSAEYKEALAAKMEEVILTMAGKEIEELEALKAEIEKVFEDQKAFDAAAVKEFEIAKQIKTEAGFETK